jgi:hypothetical protein
MQTTHPFMCIEVNKTSDKVYQLLAHGRWFSPGTPASSTTKTGRHDIAEILLKVALKHQKSKISPNPKGQVSYSHHLASVVVVRRKLFQKSSPLKVLDQWKPQFYHMFYF